MFIEEESDLILYNTIYVYIEFTDEPVEGSIFQSKDKKDKAAIAAASKDEFANFEFQRRTKPSASIVGKDSSKPSALPKIPLVPTPSPVAAKSKRKSSIFSSLKRS